MRLRNYPKQFGVKVVQLFDKLIAEKSGMPPLPEDPIQTTEELFEAMKFEDFWGESGIVSVAHYLRGGIHLKIPHSFRQLIPPRL